MSTQAAKPSKERSSKDEFLNVRVTQVMHSQLAALAERMDRTIAAEIRVAIREHLERQAQAA